MQKNILDRFNFWSKGQVYQMRHTVQSILLGNERLAIVRGGDCDSDSCGQGDCNCGGGCNSDCATSCES